MALARFLLDYYQDKGEAMPTHIIPQQTLQDISNTQEIRNLYNDKRTIEGIRNRLNYQLLNMKYLPDSDSEEWKESSTSILL